ncbi:MAG TPA: GIY-YIG nuclease family protein [Rhizomicrobium sp.]|nr:GIY-YIG nuclease family protein [Rhizomicrobium sp.]
MPSFVYVLAAKTPRGRVLTYVGWTLDLERRLAQHNDTRVGQKRAGAKTTRGQVWTLVYAEKHRTKKGAMRREFVLKNDKKFRAALRNR